MLILFPGPGEEDDVIELIELSSEQMMSIIAINLFSVGPTPDPAATFDEEMLQTIGYSFAHGP